MTVEVESDVLVFDTGPLCHFARQGWLGVLKAVVGKRLAIIPDAVVAELEVGSAKDTRLRMALEADWIERRELVSAVEVEAFAKYGRLLIAGQRNVGETAVLALAETMPATAVIDDGAGRRAAEHNGVALRPTLALLCESIRAELLTVPLVSALADDLLISSYRLPFGLGGFERWAAENGLV